MLAPGGAAARSSPLSGELGARVASGLVLGIVVLGATWLGGPLFALVWLAAGIAVLWEWLALTRTGPRGRLGWSGSTALVLLALCLVLDARPTLLAGAVLLGLLATLTAGSGRDRGFALAGFALAALTAAVPVWLRADPRLGIVGPLWLYGVVWTTDVAAYFTGRALGGPKLWPAVSPGKTWSGAAGGLIGAALVAGAVAIVGLGPLSTGAAAVVVLASALASVASQAGDLAESALKRSFGVKDSGRLIPGHGGVLDRLDGFLAVLLLAALALAGAHLAGVPRA